MPKSMSDSVIEPETSMFTKTFIFLDRELETHFSQNYIIKTTILRKNYYIFFRDPYFLSILRFFQQS